ncbi:ribosome biogenesis GTP-binding protein YihA/YsxC [Clostridiaceae bacterium M8S5]|nr:ribosome biogenesis GTP-binding protein YihA/YsxC [Clostridiaceae bacterium M8S5]
MKIRKAELLAVTAKKEQYPEEGIPEIALAGRSNVGKSSFINTLINRKKLARTSSQPGKTQTINFYNINDVFRFVDLPGYGYARVSRSQREAWGRMIDAYLRDRQSLKETFLLLDMRHEPGEHDKMMYEWIKEMGFTGYIIATKADKMSKGSWQKYTSVIAKKLDITDRRLILPFSASKKLNVEKAWLLIEDILGYEED